MSFQERNLTCPGCCRSFSFSAYEQSLCRELGHDEPKRCRTCLQSRENARRLPIAVTASGALVPP
jgi:predicted amidophosphoribosyltransferase